MGKNFSCNNLGQRKKSDFYETPYSITTQLISRCNRDGVKMEHILEPAAGNGAICKVLRSEGFQVTDYDLSDGTDFLGETRGFNTVLTNPPFSIAQDFIHKAQEIATDHIFYLLPLSYLHGKSRYDTIFTHYRNLKTVYVFTRYPMLGDELRLDGKYRTGMMVYAWYHWDKSYCGKPKIDWIDNHKYVLSARIPQP